jgi:putative NADPH-quinone reductase
MTKKIVIIQGHPDPKKQHLGHALADAYAQGAQQSGHSVQWIEVASLSFPLLHSDEDFNHGEPPEAIRKAQETIAQADHLVIFYPLWLGTLPALLKGFLEQTLRPGFAFHYPKGHGWPIKQLKGKSARVVVTMGMPAWVYRWYYHAHGLKNLKRNILGFCGLSPIKQTLIGEVENLSADQRKKWLDRMHSLGSQGK